MKKTYIKVIGIIIVGIIAIVLIYPRREPLIDYQVNKIELDVFTEYGDRHDIQLDLDKIDEFINFLNKNVVFDKKVDSLGKMFYPTYRLHIYGDRYTTLVIDNGYFYKDVETYQIHNFNKLEKGIQKYFELKE